MNEALAILATELGTTSEYLWEVLMKQAPLSAIMELIQYALLIVACIIWGIKTKDKWQEENWIWIGSVWGLLAMLIIVAFLCFPDTIYAFFHPEYWALDKILSAIGK